MSDNIYSEKLCDEKHKNIKEKFDVIDKRLDNHGERIDTIEKANIKLTEILDRLINPEKQKQGFWESKTGQRLLTFLFIVSGAIITVAIGINIIDKMPK